MFSIAVKSDRTTMFTTIESCSYRFPCPHCCCPPNMSKDNFISSTNMLKEKEAHIVKMLTLNDNYKSYCEHVQLRSCNNILGELKSSQTMTLDTLKDKHRGHTELDTKHHQELIDKFKGVRTFFEKIITDHFPKILKHKRRSKTNEGRLAAPTSKSASD